MKPTRLTQPPPSVSLLMTPPLTQLQLLPIQLPSMLLSQPAPPPQSIEVSLILHVHALLARVVGFFRVPLSSLQMPLSPPYLSHFTLLPMVRFCRLGLRRIYQPDIAKYLDCLWR